MKRMMATLAVLLVAGMASATGVRMKHTVTLKPGWNAFFLPITVDTSADEVFASWPVETVGFYDQNAFLNTQQFTTSAADSTQGAVDAGMKMWKRNSIGHSSFNVLVANGIYTAVNTNRTTFTVDLYGEPAATRVSWHVSDGVTQPLNYLGISCVSNASIKADGYLQGLDTDWSARWSISGIPTSEAPRLSDIAKNPVLSNGDVVAMDAQKSSDWSGAFFVSPASGIALGTNSSLSVISIRNDAATNRFVRVSFREGAWADGELHLAVPTVMYFDPTVHNTWQPSLRANPYERELLPGETLKLKLAVNREEELLSPIAGTEYGGVIDVTDVSVARPSGFRTSIPFSAESDGGEFRKTKWPKGLWVASVTLDKVNRTIAEENVEEYEPQIENKPYTTSVVVTNEIGTVSTNLVEVDLVMTNMVPVLVTDPIPVAKPMTMRLIVQVDAAGAMKLLQRVDLGGRRLSAAVLPAVEDPVVTSGTGTFGTEAFFAWTVGETSKVNPFRHAKHPDHDGKNVDFDGPAPSGDDFNNYLETVKPELFSIVNNLTLTWDHSSGAGWSPEESLSGTCAWSLKGLRREGKIKMSGTFTMQRVSNAD